MCFISLCWSANEYVKFQYLIIVPRLRRASILSLCSKIRCPHAGSLVLLLLMEPPIRLIRLIASVGSKLVPDVVYIKSNSFVIGDESKKFCDWVKLLRWHPPFPSPLAPRTFTTPQASSAFTAWLNTWTLGTGGHYRQSSAWRRFWLAFLFSWSPSGSHVTETVTSLLASASARLMWEI